MAYVTRGAKYMTEYFENEKNNKEIEKLNEASTQIEKEEAESEYNSIYESYLDSKSARAATGELSKTRAELKKSILGKFISRIYEGALAGTEYNKRVAKSIVNNFIDECGVDNLLKEYKTKSYMLSEFARVANNYTNAILEKKCDDDVKELVIDLNDDDDFSKEVDTDDMEDASAIIKERVSSAVDEFISDNLNKQGEIKDIIQQASQKANASKDEEVQEGYQQIAKEQMQKLEEKPKSIFECMVHNLYESCLKNDKLRKTYSENGRVSIDKVVESVKLMYTFLETVDTCKLADVDEKYITKQLESLKFA